MTSPAVSADSSVSTEPPGPRSGHPLGRDGAAETPESPITVNARPPAPAVPFTRLVHVEMRKAVDTRAGRWLLVTMALITATAVGLAYGFGTPSEQTFSTFLTTTMLPVGLFVPLLGILSVTSEWGQRTGLVTFALEPRRIRVLAAKATAVVALGTTLLAVGAGLAALATILCRVVRGGAGTWDVTWGQGGGTLLVVLIALVQGIAFGAVFLNSAAGIVTYLVLPTLWTVAASLVPWLRTAQTWADLNSASEPLIQGAMTPATWAHLAVAMTVWVLVPLVIGVLRIRRDELR